MATIRGSRLTVATPTSTAVRCGFHFSVQRDHKGKVRLQFVGSPGGLRESLLPPNIEGTPVIQPN